MWHPKSVHPKGPMISRNALDIRFSGTRTGTEQPSIPDSTPQPHLPPMPRPGQMPPTEATEDPEDSTSGEHDSTPQSPLVGTSGLGQVPPTEAMENRKDSATGADVSTEKERSKSAAEVTNASDKV